MPGHPPSLLPRLIPAHAGKTTKDEVVGVAKRAHPRSRGENPVTGEPLLDGEGSSPLTRGKPGGSDYSEALEGLIPAHAGKTPPPRRATWLPRAHPRSRGENRFCQGSGVSPKGSSPLTRGKHCCRINDRYGQRLIPAHAGKTCEPARAARPCWAHPRSRGEN